MTAATVTVTDAFNDLVDKITSGEILDAFNQHYAGNVVMVEGTGEAHEGFETNLKREKEFLAGVKEWKNTTIHATAINDNGDGSGSTFIEYSFEFVNTDDQDVRYEQVARQNWQNGKITNERFYYNAG